MGKAVLEKVPAPQKKSSYLSNICVANNIVATDRMLEGESKIGDCTVAWQR